MGINPDDSKLMERARLSGKLTPEQIAEIKKAQAESGYQRASEIIVQKGFLSPSEVNDLLGKPTPIPRPRSDTRFYDVPPDVAEARENPENLIGKYIKIRELGRGGFGSIWMAWDTGLRRRVAMKFLSTDDPENVDRFKREARTAARVSHPNIVQIYEIIDHEKPPFIVMEYIDGRDLTDMKLTLLQAAECVRDAARGVAAAHKEGVVHRDIKPHNVMRSETGRVCVMDFGLARQVKPGSSVTLTGVILGTPPYMSPEQAMGETRTDARIDVYGLGATLYELVTSQPPFLGATPVETLRMVVDRDPVPPRKLNKEIPRDLETIILKCLEKDPTRRYDTAAALAEDLDRFITGEGIAARRASVAYRVTKFVRRNRPMVVMSCLLIFASALGLLGWYLNYKTGKSNKGGGLPEEVEVLERNAKQAITDWDRLLDQRKTDITGSTGTLKTMLAQIDSKIPRYPRLHQLLHLKAQIQMRLGAPDEARKTLDAAIKLSPQTADYYFERGRCWMAAYQRTSSIYKMIEQLTFLISSDVLDRLKKDRAALMASARADFESARARALSVGRDKFAAAMIAWAAGEIPQARTLLDALVEDPGFNAEALKTHGDILAEGRTQSDLDEAERKYLEAIDIRRSYYEAYAAIGDLDRSRVGLLKIINAGEFKRATSASIARFDAALEINREFPSAFAGRAMTRFLVALRAYCYWEDASGELAKALTDDCLPLIQLEPNNYMTHGLRALINALRAFELWDGDAWPEDALRDAERDFKEGLRLSPDGKNATLGSFYGLLLVLQGRDKDAADLFDGIRNAQTLFGNGAAAWAKACRDISFGAAAQGSLTLMKLAGDPTKSQLSWVMEFIGTSPFNRLALAFYDRAFRNLIGRPVGPADRDRAENEYRHYLNLLTVAARNERGKPVVVDLAATALDVMTPILGEKAADILGYSQYRALNELPEVKSLLER